MDVKTGTTVTFDSYSKPIEGTTENHVRKYEYKNPHDRRYDFSISYNEGIMPEHLLASASVPVNFDYTHVPTTYDYSSHNNGRRDYPAVACEDNRPKEDNKLDEKITTRCCWDGGLLSNSPLREVISEHKLFWEVKREYLRKSNFQHGMNLATEIDLISQIYNST